MAANEARLRALLRNADDVVIVLDVHGRVLWVSPAVDRVFGLDHLDLVQQRAYEWTPREDRCRSQRRRPPHPERTPADHADRIARGRSARSTG